MAEHLHCCWNWHYNNWVISKVQRMLYQEINCFGDGEEKIKEREQSIEVKITGNQLLLPNPCVGYAKCEESEVARKEVTTERMTMEVVVRR